MLKQKMMGIGLTALLLGTTVLGAVAGLDLPEQNTVYAESAATELNLTNSELFLPESYEQYLPLENPAYMAMSEDYIAIADDTLLYLYVRKQNRYEVYNVAPDLLEETTISKIQFTDDQRLFFSAGGRLFEYDFHIQKAVSCPEVPCVTFLVEGDYLYAVSMSDNYSYLSRYRLDDLTQTGEQRIDFCESSIRPKLTYADGVLYCVQDNITLYSYDISGEEPQLVNGVRTIASHQVTGLSFICAYENYLYFTVNTEAGGVSGGYLNGLWRTDITDRNGYEKIMIPDDGFGAIAAYNDKLYCLKNNSLLEIAVTDGDLAYTGYEIADSSYSVNRMVGAVDAVRAGNLLVVADAAASRISVYNYATRSYFVIPCAFSPSLVATDGETIAVASGNAIYTCTYGNTSLTEQRILQASVKGLAVVYGSVYFISNAGFGTLGVDELAYNDDYGNPRRLTTDLYGYLYVSYENGKVYRFTEESFLQNNMGVEYSTVPITHTCLRADFEGNLYSLAGSLVYKNGEAFATIHGNTYVYHADDTDMTPLSFALGFEDSEVYFLFGNYFVRSQDGALDIPTLDKIAKESAVSTAFSVQSGENLFVDVPARTVGVRTETSELTGDSPYFPYVGYYRLDEAVRGILLGETSRYYLVLLTHGFGYTTNLFQKNENYLVPQDEYWEDATGEYSLSSDVYAYYAPCLDTALSDLRVDRGTSVTVTGYVVGLDFEYALVEYIGRDYLARTGYVPRSFLTEISPVPEAGRDFFHTVVKENPEGTVFYAADGSKLTVTERTEATATAREDGTYLVCVKHEGVEYFSLLTEDDLEWNNSDALRIALIVILSVLALLIVAGYIFLLPRKKSTATDEQPKKKFFKKEPPPRE